MVDEKKVRIMTDIARDEKNLDKKILKYGGYYKKDYVRSHMLSAIGSFSMAYFLIIFLVVLYYIDFFLIDFVALDYTKLGLLLAVSYFFMVMICVVMSKIYYGRRYDKDYVLLERYHADLQRLKDYYSGDGKENTDASVTGN